MPNLISRIVYAFMGRPVPKVRTCKLCSRSWSDAGPFIEGPKNALICRHCIDRLFADNRDFVPRTDGEPATELPNPNSDDTNPYAPSAAVNDSVTCFLCGDAVPRDQLPAPDEPVALCFSCIVTSKEMIDAELQRTQEVT